MSLVIWPFESGPLPHIYSIMYGDESSESGGRSTEDCTEYDVVGGGEIGVYVGFVVDNGKLIGEEVGRGVWGWSVGIGVGSIEQENKAKLCSEMKKRAHLIQGIEILELAHLL